jgi:hypothetical protein
MVGIESLERIQSFLRWHYEFDLEGSTLRSCLVGNSLWTDSPFAQPVRLASRITAQRN